MAQGYLHLSKKLLLIVFTWGSLLVLSGCWDRVEINDLAIVLAAGIDKTEDDQIELTVQLAIPNQMGGGQQQGSGSGGQGEKPTLTKQATGTTISEAASILQQKVPRRIFWGHNTVIVFGKELAEGGIREYVEFFAHHPEPRLRSFVFVSEERASALLEVIPYLEQSSSQFARELARFQIGLRVTLKDLLESISGGARAVALPGLEYEYENVKEKKGGLNINGTAVFKEDKMEGYLDDRLTRGLLWIRNEVHLATVSFTPENADGYMSFKLLRSNTQLHPEIKDGKWKMTLAITTEDDIEENQTDLVLTDPKIIAELEEQLAAKIDERIEETLSTVQKEMKADVLGFAKSFEQKYPDEWEQVKDRWEEKFAEVEIEVVSKAYIRRLGMSTQPQGIPEEEMKEE
ncbi:Ger(x)C family spore germination protein [Thalassobacillus devorans]|uniref:Ger(x)C family spore germination protein n=1 Tax=Thalassobacillus devorans TaxID=279813 RepID=UPI000A1CC78A|nr:Ger(x)C family spore germination protein [Thalassobacillus devorans]